MANKKIKTTTKSKTRTTPASMFPTFRSWVRIPNLPRKTWLKLSPLLAIGGFLALLLVASTVLTTVNYVRLEIAGRKLTKLQKEIEKTGLDIETYRDRYCWRTREKFSKGTRYCDQRLIVVGKNKDVPTQIKESEAIVRVLERVYEVGLYDQPYSTYSDTGVAIQEKYIKPQTFLTSGYGIDYMAYDDSRSYDALSRNIYTLDIRSSELITLFSIYPFSGNYSWETYAD